VKRRTFYVLVIGATVLVTGVSTVAAMVVLQGGITVSNQQQVTNPTPASTSAPATESAPSQNGQTPDPEVFWHEEPVGDFEYMLHVEIAMNGAERLVIGKGAKGKIVKNVTSSGTYQLAGPAMEQGTVDRGTYYGVYIPQEYETIDPQIPGWIVNGYRAGNGGGEGVENTDERPTYD